MEKSNLKTEGWMVAQMAEWVRIFICFYGWHQVAYILAYCNSHLAQYTINIIASMSGCLLGGVVLTFHLIVDHLFQLLIDSIIHVVPFQDLTPFVFSVAYYSTTKNTNGNSKQ